VPDRALGVHAGVAADAERGRVLDLLAGERGLQHAVANPHGAGREHPPLPEAREPHNHELQPSTVERVRVHHPADRLSVSVNGLQAQQAPPRPAPRFHAGMMARMRDRSHGVKTRFLSTRALRRR
jgi:hypothetical protein